MSTRAYEDFQKSIARAQELLEVHSKITQDPGRPPQWASDILRAVLVFVMASWDSYVHDAVHENSFPLVKRRKGRNLPKELLVVLKEAVPYDKLLELLGHPQAGTVISSSIRKRNADRTFMKPDKAEEAFKLVGLESIWSVAAKAMGRRRDGLHTAFENYAKRRDKIAHEGDVGKATRSKGKLARIQRPYVEKALNDVLEVVGAMDKAIEDQLNA